MKKFLEQITIDDLLPILDSVSDAVFVDDRDGMALWCNKACKELYKVTPADICGIPVSELEKSGVFTPSVATMVLEQKKEVTIVHENREGKRLLTTGIPIVDASGGISKVITTSRDITELVSLQNQLEIMQSTLQDLKAIDTFSHEGIVAASPAMFNVLQLAQRLSTVDSTVLITGESGVGKGIIAELLHQSGNRKSFPFIKVNCGAIPESLIESELFGYDSGAFTGSRAEGKVGLFEEAQNGTIFLDEIAELPLNLQVTLLQVIQEREIKRVGSVKSIPINVRIISATNRELHELIQKGQFREDLYYRLNVVPIHVPPLRERPEDILPLVQVMLSTYNKKLGEQKEIDSTTLAVLLKYNWPGNVRELQNIIERLLITTKSSIILPENLPTFLYESTNLLGGSGHLSDMTLKDSLNRAEKQILLQAHKKYKSTRAMAKALEVSQPTIVRKMAKYGIKTEN